MVPQSAQNPESDTKSQVISSNSQVECGNPPIPSVSHETPDSLSLIITQEGSTAMDVSRKQLCSRIDSIKEIITTQIPIDPSKLRAAVSCQVPILDKHVTELG